MAIKKADLVICASESRKMIMEQSYKTKNGIVVVNNVSILPRGIPCSAVNDDYPELGLFFKDLRKTVVYAGVLDGRKINLLVCAADRCKERIKVLIVGSGKEKQQLLGLKKELNANNVMIMDSVPYDYLFPILSRCDVGYIFYSNDKLNNINCAPNKIYEYVSAGLPIISNENEGVKYYSEKYKIGISSDDLETALYEVLDNWGYYKHNIDEFLKRIDYQKELGKIDFEISKMLKERK